MVSWQYFIALSPLSGAVNSTPIVSAYGCTLGGNQQHNSSTKTTLPQTSSETVTHLSTPRVFLTKITSASAQSSSTHFQNNVESRTLIDETAITSTRNPGRQISSQIQWSTVLVNSDSSSPRAATMQTGSPVPSGPKSDTPPGDVPVLDTMQTDRLQITVNPPTHASLIEETETAYHASQSSFTTSKMTSISFYEAQITSTQLPETREGVSTAASSHSSSLSAVTQYTRTTEAESKPRPFSETASAERSWGNQCKPIQETTSNFNVTAHTSMSAESNLTISHSTAAQSNAQVTNADGRRSTRTTLAQGQTSADPSSVQAGAPSSKATDSSPISTDSTSSPAASKKEAVLMSTTTTAKSPTFHETRTTDISAISQTTGYTSMAQDPHNTDSLTSRSIRMTGSTGTSYQSDLLPTLFSRYISAVESSGVANTGPSTPPTSAANVVTLQLASQPTTTTLGADPIHDTVRIKTSQITASSPTYAAMVALTETVNGGSEASLTVSQMTSISSDATPITGKPSVRTPETPYMTISSLSSSPSLIQPTQAVESKSETRPYHETIFLHHITTSQRETTRFTSMDTVMNVANPTVAGAGGSSATRPTITDLMLSTKLTPIASHHEVSGTMETTLPSTTSASRDADAIEAISQVGPVVTRQPVSSHATRKTVPQATPTPGPCQIPSRQATPPAATSSITPSSTENLLVTITAAMMGLESTPNEILPHSTEIVPAEVIVPTADDNSIVKSLETRQQSLVSLSPIASVSTSPAIDISLDDESASGVISYDTKPAASDVVPSVVSTAIDSQHGVCPPEFHYVNTVNRCYRIIYEAVNWTTAHVRCGRNVGARLVSVMSTAENDAVVSVLSTVKPWRALACFDTYGYHPWASGYWIAGQRRDPNHCVGCQEDFIWRWDDATEPIPLSMYSNWAASEPNCVPSRYGSAESCLQYGLGPRFAWYDVNCAATFCPVCEMVPQTISFDDYDATF